MGECLIVKSDSGVDTSNATATYDTIVEGYSCYVNDELVVGNIPIQSTQNHIDSDESIMLQSGYYAKNNTILVNSLENETLGNADFSTVLINNSGWVNGNFIDGAMVIIEDFDYDFNPNDVYHIPTGWHSGNSKITQTITPQDTLVVTPTLIDQEICTGGVYTVGDIIISGDSHLLSGNIKNGVDIFGITGNFTGWVDDTYEVFRDSKYVANTKGGTFNSYTIDSTNLSTYKSSFNGVTIEGSIGGKRSNKGYGATGFIDVVIDNVVTSVATAAFLYNMTGSASGNKTFNLSDVTNSFVSRAWVNTQGYTCYDITYSMIVTFKK